VQADAEYGKWKNCYWGVSGSQASTERSKWFRRLQVFCNDPLIHLSPLIQWNGGEGYYRIMKHEGDRTVDVKR
jgi:hypothetical protein